MRDGTPVHEPPPKERKALLPRLLAKLPIVGYGMRCAGEERVGELLLLIVNGLMAFAIVVLIWGFAGFITALLGLTLLVGLLVFSTTMLD